MEELLGLELNYSTAGRIQSFRLILFLQSFVYSQSKLFYTKLQRVIISSVFIIAIASEKHITLIRNIKQYFAIIINNMIVNKKGYCIFMETSIFNIQSMNKLTLAS